MNLSWTAQRGNLFLSLGVKTLWKTKLWLIRAQSDESWSWFNCVWKNREPHLAVVSELLWSLLLSRIQLSSLQHSNPLKKNFTGAQHLHTVWTTAINKHSYLPHRGFSHKDVLWKTLITPNKSLSLSTTIFVLHVIHVLLSSVFVVALFIQWCASLIESAVSTHKLKDNKKISQHGILLLMYGIFSDHT